MRTAAQRVNTEDASNPSTNPDFRWSTGTAGVVLRVPEPSIHSELRTSADPAWRRRSLACRFHCICPSLSRRTFE